MEMETLILERKEHFLWIKLNRPEALNALNTQMAKDLLSVAQDAALDQDIWVIGITSTTDKAFGVGADLKERKDMTAGEISSQRVLFTRTTLALKSLPQPVIAGVKGFALGGGLETALWADIIIAGETPNSACPKSAWG